MNSAKNRFSVCYITFDKCYMMLSIQFIDISVNCKFSVSCRHFCFCNTLYQNLMFFSVLHKISNRSYLKVMLFCKFHKIRCSCHSSVIFHDFTAKSNRFKSGKSYKVYSCFCVAVSFKYTTFLCF